MSVAFVPEKTRISVDRYQKMVATGVFTERDRIELIDGEMIKRIQVHREPVGNGSYEQTHEFGMTEIVSPTDCPILGCD